VCVYVYVCVVCVSDQSGEFRGYHLELKRWWSVRGNEEMRKLEGHLGVWREGVMYVDGGTERVSPVKEEWVWRPGGVAG